MMPRERQILDDARMLFGYPPHDQGGNICEGDGYFAKDCERHWGKVAFDVACKEARRLHALGMKAYKKAVKLP
jgi:hypothetical protein